MGLFGLILAFPVHAEIGEIDVNAGPPTTIPAPTDASTLWINSGTFASLVVVDAHHKRTGVDAKTYNTLLEIPNSACDVDFTKNQYTGEEHSEVSERITFQPAVKGIYELHLTGLQPGPFEVRIAGLTSEGSSIPVKNLDGLISEGQVKIFKLLFDPSPTNNHLTVVEH